MKKRKDIVIILLICLVYILSNCLLVFSPGVWWDDWTIYNPDIDVLRHQFVSGGLPHIATFHVWVAEHISMEYIPQLYHLISFISGGLCLWMTWIILKWFKLEKMWIVGIALLVASSPLFSARITMSCIQYYISVPLFLLGVVLFLRYVRCQTIYYRVGAFLFFFLSLFVWLTAIVMIPAFLVMMSIYLCPRVKTTKWLYSIQILKQLIVWFDFLLLPIFIWIIRLLWLAPTEVYGEAYALSIGKLIQLPLVLLKSFIDSAVGYLRQCFDIPFNDSTYLVFAVITIICLIGLIYWVLQNITINNSLRKSNRLLLVGLWLYFPAIIATSTMGVAVFGSFASRYQALLVVPVALLIFWVILMLRIAVLQKIALGLLVVLGVLANINTQLQFQKGWIKSMALVQIIRNNPVLQVPYSNVIVIDQMQDFNPYKLPLDYYVFSGISKLALDGNQTHFYTDSLLTKIYFTSPTREVILRTLYNCKESQNIDCFNHQLILYSAKETLNTKLIVRFWWKYYTDRLAFEQDLASFINYQILPIKKM